MPSTWLRQLLKSVTGKPLRGGRHSRHKPRPTCRPQLEQFESRLVPTNPTVSIPTNLTGPVAGTVTVPINVDSLNADSGDSGLIAADLVVVYNPNLFAVTAGDVNLGTIATPSGGDLAGTANGDGYAPATAANPTANNGWTVSVLPTAPNSLNGLLDIQLSNDGTGIITAAGGGGALVTVNFHILSSAVAGTTTPIDLAADTGETPPTPLTDQTFLVAQTFNNYTLLPNPNFASPPGIGPADNATLNSAFSPPSFTYSGSDPDDGLVTFTPEVAHFNIVAPSAVGVSNPFRFTVTAINADNTFNTAYSGTVGFYSTDTTAVFPSGGVLVNGTGVFTATLNTAGNQYLFASDASGMGGTSNAIIVEGPHFGILAPSTVTSGSPFLFLVEAENADGSIDTGYSGVVHFTSSDSVAILPSDSSFSNGIGYFAAVLTTPGNQTLSVVDANNVNITGVSNLILVVPSGPHFAFSGVPIAVTAGTTFTFTVTAELGDGSVNTGYSGVVQFTSTDSIAALPSNAGLVGGVGTFQATFKTTGSQTLTATDTVTSSITGSSPAIIVKPGTLAKFVLNLPQGHTSGSSSVLLGGVTAGSPFVLTVTADDQFNNVVTSYKGTVHLTGTDNQATLPADATLTNGVGNFAVVLKTAGNQTITAVDTTASSLSGSSGTIIVQPGAASHLVLGVSSSATPGTSFAVTVTAYDAFNNLANGYTGTVGFSTSDNQAVLPASGTLTSGKGIFSVTLKTAGNQTLVATGLLAGPSFNQAFGSPIAVAATNPYAIIAGDFNADGILDFAVTSNGSKTVTIFEGDGDGTFLAGATYALGGGQLNGLAAADLNGDGKLDLVVVSSSGSGASVSVLLGNGDDTFQPPVPYAVGEAGTTANGVAVGDFNGDGKLDLAVTASNGDTSPGYVAVLLGNGNGQFQTAADFPVGDDPSGIAVADFNNDGKADIAVTNNATDSSTVSVLLGNGNGTFGPDNEIPVGMNPVGIVVADFNRDGNADIAVSDTGSNSVSVLIGRGDGNFTVSGAITGTQSGQVTGPGGLAVADVNGDGKLDLVVANGGTGNVGVLLNMGNGSFATTAVTFAAGNEPVSVAAGDFNGDAAPDVAVVNSASDNITILLNQAITGRAKIAVSSTAPTHFTVSAPSAAEVGNSFTITVTAQDQFNSTIPGYTGTVQFTSSDGQALLPANTTLTSGVGTFSVTLQTVGNQTISVADTSSASISGSSAAIDVSAAPVLHFLVTAPGTTTAGSPFIVIVTAEDSSNNIFAGYNGTVQFTSSDSLAQVSAPLVPFANGVGYFAATLKTAGNQTLVAADTSTSTVTGTSNTIAVAAAAATHFGVTAVLPSYSAVPTGPSSFAVTGLPLVFSVTALDPFNNTAPTYSGTVQFSSSDTAAGVVLPPLSILTSGIGSFSATLMTPGNQTLVAADTVFNSGPSAIGGVSSPIVTRGLVATSFTPANDGFTITFDKPFNPSTVNLYTGNGTLPDDAILATTNSQVSVRGSLLINAADTSITFVKTDTVSALGTFNPSSGLLAAGNYTVTLRSFSAGSSGFQDALGGFLDGTNSGGPGSSFQATFAVAAAPVSVGIPDFARGPSVSDALTFTGLTNGSTFALTYTNPAATPTTGTATITYSSTAATLQSNIQTALTNGGLATQIGVGPNNTPNSIAIAINATNVVVTFQNALVQTTQLLTSTTPGVAIAPGSINAANNMPGNGIPLAISSGLNVTSGTFTLQYNATLLTITGVVPSAAVSAISGATFTLVSNTVSGTSGTAVLSLSSPSRLGTGSAAVTLGSLLATVPLSAASSYGAKQLLHFSSEQLGGTAGAIPVTNEDAVQAVAYFGDVTDEGAFNLQDASGISTIAGGVANTIAQTIPGFPAFPNLDPAIIGDVSLQGLVNATDAGTMNQELSGSARGTIPIAPIGLTIVAAGPDPTLSVPAELNAVPGSTVVVPVDIDTPRPAGSTGMVDAVLALAYDPQVFDVSAADVELGTVPAGGTGWQLKTQVNSQTGLIGIELFSATGIQSTDGGSLVTIVMRVRDTAPAGTTSLKFVPFVDPTGGLRVYQTQVSDAQDAFVLHETMVGPAAEVSLPLVPPVDPPLTTGSGRLAAENELSKMDGNQPIPGYPEFLSDNANPSKFLEPEPSASALPLPLPVVDQVFQVLAQAAANSQLQAVNLPLLTADDDRDWPDWFADDQP